MWLSLKVLLFQEALPPLSSTLTVELFAILGAVDKTGGCPLMFQKLLSTAVVLVLNPWVFTLLSIEANHTLVIHNYFRLYSMYKLPDARLLGFL